MLLSPLPTISNAFLLAERSETNMVCMVLLCNHISDIVIKLNIPHT